MTNKMTDTSNLKGITENIVRRAEEENSDLAEKVVKKSREMLRDFSITIGYERLVKDLKTSSAKEVLGRIPVTEEKEETGSRNEYGYPCVDEKNIVYKKLLINPLTFLREVREYGL